jgi:hypothetical protein
MLHVMPNNMTEASTVNGHPCLHPMGIDSEVDATSSMMSSACHDEQISPVLTSLTSSSIVLGRSIRDTGTQLSLASISSCDTPEMYVTSPFISADDSMSLSKMNTHLSDATVQSSLESGEVELNIVPGTSILMSSLVSSASNQLPANCNSDSRSSIISSLQSEHTGASLPSTREVSRSTSESIVAIPLLQSYDDINAATSNHLHDKASLH